MKNTPKDWNFPYRDLIGFEIEDIAPSYCRIGLPLRGDHNNRHGAAHGGVYAGLLDTAMGISGCFTENPDEIILPMTLSFTVNFLTAALEGRVTVEARCTGGGRKIYFAEARAFGEDGTVIATATGSFKRRSG